MNEYNDLFEKLVNFIFDLRIMDSVRLQEGFRM